MDTAITPAPRPRLRPGWRIPLTVVGMFGFVGAGVGVSVGLSLSPLSEPLVRVGAVLAMSAAAVAIGYCLRRFVDRRPVRDLGLSWRPADLLRLLAGSVLAAIVVLVAHLANVLLGLSRWQPSFGEGLPLLPGLLLGYLMIMLGQAFPEELLWRGYLFTSLSAEWRRRAVIIATSVGFGAMHVISNPGADTSIGWRLLYAVMACGFGFALAACRVRSHSIWLAVGFHVGHNFTKSILGGAYDWSLLVSFAVFCGFGAVLLWTSPKPAASGVVEMPTQTATKRLRPVDIRGNVVRRWGFFLGAAAVVVSTMVAAPAVAAEPDCGDGIARDLLAAPCESEPDTREPEVEGVNRLEKSVDRESYEPGDVLTFTIEIAASDSGTSTDNFEVFDRMDDVLDDAVYNDDAAVSTGWTEMHETDGAWILRWWGQLEPGESAKLTFSVTANAKGDKQIRNFALHAAHNGSECGFSRSHGPAPGDIDFDDVPGVCKVTVPPGDEPDDNGDTTPVADNGSTLPSTGTSLGMYIAVAAALLIIGGVLLVVTRNRRSRLAETD